MHAVRVVAAGDALLAPSVTRRILEDYPRRPAPRGTDTGIERLTERELEVLRLLATGRSNMELAAGLWVGEGTVKTHVSNVLTKLVLRGSGPSRRLRLRDRPGPTRAVNGLHRM